MGNACSNRDTTVPSGQKAPEPKPSPQPKVDGKKAPAPKPGPKAKPAPQPQPPAADDQVPQTEFTKQVQESIPLFCTMPIGKDKNCFGCCVPKNASLEFGCLMSNGQAFSVALTEVELNPKKESVKCTWPAFFKSLRAAFPANKVTCKDANPTSTCQLQIPMESNGKTVTISLTLKSAGKDQTVGYRLFIEAMCNYHAKRMKAKDDEKFQKIEVDMIAAKSACYENQQRIQTLQAELEPLAKNSKQAQEDARGAKEQCESVSRRIAKLQNPSKVTGDPLYPDGPARYNLHTQHAKEHVPMAIVPNRRAMHLIKQKYGGDTSQPPIGNDDMAHDEIIKSLGKIDDWDYDVFALKQQTGGGALFMTAYSLLYQYGLVQHFKIDEQVLINFLQAVESGYHPNPYHNSTHAADVLQVTHFILRPGGMAKAIGMFKEDELAALLSATIHDYDHPGFNNNFHCRTNAYLATLYNDRSVLENHHLARVFDLMKNQKYNILQSLSEDQRKDIRDTMIEMVLSTDMGNHAKIFQSFRKRLNEDQEWTRKDDQRLALSIAIKMADISNCARPQNLYLEWARMIAEEFYNQGDVEARLKFTISPFMDRKKDKTDFSKGQISFMNYIVIPLFEAGGQFLPDTEFTVTKIQENKEYWQKKQEDEP